MHRGWRVFTFPVIVACAVFRMPASLQAQQAQQLGKIIGSVRVVKADAPSPPVLVTLEMRESPIGSAYTDGQGRFGFFNLVSNEYKVMITDDAYNQESVITVVNPSNSPMNFVQFTLTPRPTAKKDPLPGRVGGSNPYLIDPAEYNRQFPKKTLKEFEKGVDADHQGKTDEAIQHYEKALTYSPEFYPAHNNLGSAYLGRHEAERKVDEGLQRRPDSAFGKFLQGSVYSRTGRPELAEKSLQSALQLDPKMSQGYLQLVNLYVQQKRTAEAIRQLEAYLKAFPDAPFSPKARELLKRLQGEASASATPR